jgi:hypothetical protein
MIKRNRPRPNGGIRTHRPHQNGYSSGSNSKNDDNSEVRLKNRNYYQQMYDKYSTAARESLSLGERIEAEGHFQHAEHYLRQLNDRIRYDNEVQQQRNQTQQAQYQAQQAQQAQQAARNNVQPELTESAENTAPVENNNNDADASTSTQEKRPYRKRTLRTPHRRHTQQDAAPQSASPASDSIIP